MQFIGDDDVLKGFREIHDNETVASELKITDKHQSILRTKIHQHPRSNNQSPLNMTSSLEKRSRSYLTHVEPSV